MRLHDRRQLTSDLAEHLLDLVLSSRFWAALLVAALVTWFVVAPPLRIESDGRVVVSNLPASVSDTLGLDDSTLENPEPPQ